MTTTTQLVYCYDAAGRGPARGERAAFPAAHAAWTRAWGWRDDADAGLEEGVTMLPTIAWRGRSVVMIDQRKLPALRRPTSAAGPTSRWPRPSRRWSIRGAPAIGIAAAYGLVLGVDGRLRAATGRSLDREFEKIYARLERTRPTARQPVLGPGADEGSLRARTRRQACGPTARGPAEPRPGPSSEEDAETQPGHRPPRRRRCCPTAGRVLTHCNAGALATGRATARPSASSGPRSTAGKQITRLRRRDPALPAGGAADRLGARRRTASRSP
ncbi:MAG: hypothetical protein MZV65_53300 [Chromatiales bacterium]|nr:hypothetical protein [Chromatiales bacterium]